MLDLENCSGFNIWTETEILIYLGATLIWLLQNLFMQPMFLNSDFRILLTTSTVNSQLFGFDC